VFVNRSVVERLCPQFFTDFRQILHAAQKLVALTPIVCGQTGSSLPILEVCGLQLWQFSGCGDHIFQQVSTKCHVQIKFSNADFVFNGE